MSDNTVLRRNKWDAIDFPVLIATAEAFDDGVAPILQDGQITVDGLSEADVTGALIRLIERGGYIDGEVSRTLGGGSFVVMRGLSERGLRATGVWPTDDRAVESVVAALESAAERETDPAKKSKIVSAARAVGQVVGTAAGETLGAFVRQQLGIPS